MYLERFCFSLIAKGKETQIPRMYLSYEGMIITAWAVVYDQQDRVKTTKIAPHMRKYSTPVKETILLGSFDIL